MPILHKKEYLLQCDECGKSETFTSYSEIEAWNVIKVLGWCVDSLKNGNKCWCKRCKRRESMRTVNKGN